VAALLAPSTAYKAITALCYKCTHTQHQHLRVTTGTHYRCTGLVPLERLDKQFTLQAGTLRSSNTLPRT